MRRNKLALQLMRELKISSPLASARQREDGIIHEVYHAVKVNIQDLEAHIEASRQAFGSTGYYISDIRQLKSVCQQSRKHLAHHSVAKASALIVSSGFSTIVGNIFLKFNQPDFASKLFTSEEKALAWIKEQQALDN
ncbi:hypothetical protein SapgrDRAFT_0096 [Saprospira grandis DSM 2844]|uniref:DUF7793 domain-containing protein n=2 Tax=Saprospira TaxID=1007 RepID=J1HZP2_9BACT|nr:hypothetical protein SapgrDRAFT_0096 [Saprospira grandis DSM 2844]